MNLLHKTLILLLIAGFYSPAYAAVADVNMTFCGIYSDADSGGDKKDGENGDKKEGEAEPDCE